MPSTQVRMALYAEFKRVWDSIADAPRASYDNDESPEVLTSPTGDEFVRVSVRHIGSNQQTIGAVGNRTFRRDAMLIVQVFVLAGTSNERADQIANYAREIFEGKQIGSAYFSAVELAEIGVEENTGYYNLNVVAPFYYHERI